MKQSISNETQNEAMRIAKATQKPGQTKEQTKLISQGIEKGIAEYKKQQKARAREADKYKKKLAREKEPISSEQPLEAEANNHNHRAVNLPWLLLSLSWLGFATYLLFFH